MNMARKTKRSPTVWISALIATSALAVTYKLYQSYFKSEQEELEARSPNADNADITKYVISPKYSNKSIVITLSSTFISSKIPLNEILLNSENMIFIIPPNLNEEDLNVNIPPNYKLLKCSNVDGYLQVLKNLKPDLLFLCSDDLGINLKNLSSDLKLFIKTIVNVDQSKEDIYCKLRPIFG
ncbi:Peroxisome assembly protein 22 [Spathaspora sp. JA1]|nr:Peroxisome assembly protein 22 [Spathaspora sp. JA1]